MSASDEQPSKQTRKRDWLDWGQGMVALLTALLAVWINFQQQGLKSQQDNIDLGLKKESATTLFTDKIVQQLNILSEGDSKIIKGAVILELMRIDIQAHLLSKTDQDKRLKDLEKHCEDIPSRIALFTANFDALDAREEARWVEYAYNTDNRIARHTALQALGRKALEPGHFSPAGSVLPNLPLEGHAAADLLSNRLAAILKLSDNLESPDLAIDALDAISRLADRFQGISFYLKGTDTLDLILRGMRNLQSRLNPQAGSDTPDQLEQKLDAIVTAPDLAAFAKQRDQSKQQLHDQLIALESTWNRLIAAKFCSKEDRQVVATVSTTSR
jgi:hypothetical protein